MSEGSSQAGDLFASVLVTRDGFQEATVKSVDQRRCRVEVGLGSERDALVTLPGYAPTPGDRVLIAGSAGSKSWIIGVIEAEALPALETRSGHRVTLADDGETERVRLRDAQDTLLLEFDPDTGRALIRAPSGDLTLAAPAGHVDLVAGRGVRCAAREDIILRAGGVGEDAPSSSLRLSEHQAAIQGDEVEVTGRRATVRLGETSFVGERLEATLSRARWAIDRVESRLEQLVERLGSAHRTVEGLQQVTAGRMRALVRGAYQVKADHGSIKARSDLKLDGKKIYLG